MDILSRVELREAMEDEEGGEAATVKVHKQLSPLVGAIFPIVTYSNGDIICTALSHLCVIVPSFLLSHIVMVI